MQVFLADHNSCLKKKRRSRHHSLLRRRKLKKLDLYNIVTLEVRKTNILGLLSNDHPVNTGGHTEVNPKYVFLVDAMLSVSPVGSVNMQTSIGLCDLTRKKTKYKLDIDNLANAIHK